MFPAQGSGRAGFFHQVLCLQEQKAKENKRQERSGAGGTCASGSCNWRRAVNAGRLMDAPAGPRQDVLDTHPPSHPAVLALPAAALPTPLAPLKPPAWGWAGWGAAGPVAPGPKGQPCTALPPDAKAWLLSQSHDPKGVIYRQPGASPSSPPEEAAGPRQPD